MAEIKKIKHDNCKYIRIFMVQFLSVCLGRHKIFDIYVEKEMFQWQRHPKKKTQKPRGNNSTNDGSYTIQPISKDIFYLLNMWVLEKIYRIFNVQLNDLPSFNRSGKPSPSLI